VRLSWSSAAEGAQFAQNMTEFVEEVRALGPLAWPSRPVLESRVADTAESTGASV